MIIHALNSNLPREEVIQRCLRLRVDDPNCDMISILLEVGADVRLVPDRWPWDVSQPLEKS